MKKEPKRKDYYDYDLYREDSLKWMNDPLFGWSIKTKNRRESL